MDKIEVGKKLVALAYDSNVMVDNSVFTTLDVSERGTAVSGLMKVGGTPKFVDNFNFLTDYAAISVKLKKGEDASLELAFNGITLPEGFKEAVAEYQRVITPVMDTLKALQPVSTYPFAKVPDRATYPNCTTGRIERNGYTLEVHDARNIWNKIKAYWAGNTKRKPESISIYTGGHGYKTVTYYKEKIAIGCQEIPRWEVEAIAKHYDWTFPKVL
jgi:hypothetical protein